MGVRKKKSAALPDYMPTQEERDWFSHCVNNGIIISPMGINGKPDEWHIGISFKGRHKEVNKTPSIYTRDNIWQETYLMMKYYYDKHRG